LIKFFQSKVFFLISASTNGRARKRVEEEWISIGEKRGIDGSAIDEWNIPDNSISCRAKAKRLVAEYTHDNTKGNIDDIISRTSTIREASSIAANDTQVALQRGWCWWSGGVEPKHLRGNDVRWLIEPVDPSKKRGDEIFSREVRRGNGTEVRSEDRVYEVKEEDVDNLRKGRIEDVLTKVCCIIHWNFSIEFALIRKSNHDLVNERGSETGDLSASNVVIAIVDDLTYTCPGTNDRVLVGIEEAGNGNFKDERVHTAVSEDVVGNVVGDAAGEGGCFNGDEVDKVEDLSKVH